jgi:hypothetical protein
MAKTRTEILDDILSLIDSHLARVKVQNTGRPLDDRSARIVCELGKAVAIIDKNMRENEKEKGDEAKSMTDEELEAFVLKEAASIGARRAAK